MTTFYFVRHGETMVNRAQCFNGGGTNSTLTEAGQAAAKRLGSLLADQSFDALLTCRRLINHNRQSWSWMI